MTEAPEGAFPIDPWGGSAAPGVRPAEEVFSLFSLVHHVIERGEVVFFLDPILVLLVLLFEKVTTLLTGEALEVHRGSDPILFLVGGQTGNEVLLVFLAVSHSPTEMSHFGVGVEKAFCVGDGDC